MARATEFKDRFNVFITKEGPELFVNELLKQYEKEALKTGTLDIEFTFGKKDDYSWITDDYNWYSLLRNEIFYSNVERLVMEQGYVIKKMRESPKLVINVSI